MKRLFAKHGLFFSAIFFMFYLGCSNSPTSSVPTPGTIKISIKGVTNGAPSSLNKSSSFVTVTSARVVIKRIRFDSSVEDTLDFRFREPFIQDLMVNSDLTEIETIQVPFGSYKKSTVKIDDLDAEDGTVYTQNPDLQDRSILILGVFNGNPFTFVSDLDKDQEKEFQPPLVLTENSSSTNVVLSVNLAGWFVDENSNPLDPSLIDNKSKIENNIKDSIDVYEDEDDDGERDD